MTKVELIKQAAKKLRELATIIASLNLSKTDGGMDEALDALPILWIEAYNALACVGFQPLADLRRVAARRAGTAWLMTVAEELETDLSYTE